MRQIFNCRKVHSNGTCGAKKTKHEKASSCDAFSWLITGMQFITEVLLLNLSSKFCSALSELLYEEVAVHF